MIKLLRKILTDLPDDTPVYFEFDINGSYHKINVTDYKVALEVFGENNSNGLVFRKNLRYKLSELLSEMPNVGKDTDFLGNRVAQEESPVVGGGQIKTNPDRPPIRKPGSLKDKLIISEDFVDPLFDDDVHINFMLDQLNDSINRTSTSIDSTLEFIDSSDKRIAKLQQIQVTKTEEDELNKCNSELLRVTAETRDELIEALKELDATLLELQQRVPKKYHY